MAVELLLAQESKITAVVGGQWGDEGKGKISDLIAQQAALVIRGQGGDNAGHTTVTEQFGTIVLHQTPDGILNPEAYNLIGPGVVFNPESFIEELASLKAQGVDTSKLRISSLAHLLFPFHRVLDRWQESTRYLQGNEIGTTSRGIGPAYRDKSDRIGIRVGDLNDKELFLQNVINRLKVLNDVPGVDRIIKDILFVQESKLADGQKIRNLVTKDELSELLEPGYYEQKWQSWHDVVSPLIDRDDITGRVMAKGGRILAVGGQGTLLDLDYGTYPYVTSSHTTIDGVLKGAGLYGARNVLRIGVFKAIMSKVGEGPMPTRLDETEAASLRQKWGEFGATTSRPRDLGWFDMMLAEYAQNINGFDKFVLTAVDRTADVENLRVARRYIFEGQIIDSIRDVSANRLDRCSPVYTDRDFYSKVEAGFDRHTRFDDLPRTLQNYIGDIGFRLGISPLAIGVGPEREDIIMLRS